MEMAPLCASLFILLATLPVVAAEVHYYFIGGGAGLIILIIVIVLRCCLLANRVSRASQPGTVVVRRRWLIWRTTSPSNGEEAAGLPEQAQSMAVDPPSYTTATKEAPAQPPSYGQAVAANCPPQPGYETQHQYTSMPVAGSYGYGGRPTAPHAANLETRVPAPV